MTNPPDTSVTERVARAIYEHEPILHNTQFSGREPWSWRDLTGYFPETAEQYRAKARAAISSMPALEEENAILRPRSKDNLAGEAAALRSAADFLMAHHIKARCDNPAVSDCVNCNTVYLASTMLKLLGRAALSPRKEDQQ